MDNVHNKFPIGSEIITPSGWMGTVKKHEARKCRFLRGMVYEVICESKDGKTLRFSDFDRISSYTKIRIPSLP